MDRVIDSCIANAKHVSADLDKLLFNACRDGNYQLVDKIIERNCDYCELDFCEAFCCACESGSLILIEMIIGLNHSVDLKKGFRIAAKYNHLHIIKYFEQFVEEKRNKSDNFFWGFHVLDYQGALEYCGHKATPETFDYLLDKYIDVWLSGEQLKTNVDTSFENLTEDQYKYRDLYHNCKKWAKIAAFWKNELLREHISRKSDCFYESMKSAYELTGKRLD